MIQDSTNIYEIWGGGGILADRPNLHTTMVVHTTMHGVYTGCTKLGGDSTQDKPNYGTTESESDSSDSAWNSSHSSSQSEISSLLIFKLAGTGIVG